MRCPRIPISPRPRIGGVAEGLKARSASHIGGATSRVGLIFLTIALVVFFQVAAGDFATRNNLISILVSAATTLIASIAMARLIIAGQIDLSIGGMYAVISCGLGIRDARHPERACWAC